MIRDIYIDTYNRNKPKVKKSKQANRKGKEREIVLPLGKNLRLHIFFFLDPPAFYHSIYVHT